MSVAYSFAKGERNTVSGDRTNSPSPDNYDPQLAMKIVKESSPEWTISRTERPNAGDINPGPGAYDADPNRLKMSVSVSMGSRPVIDFRSPQKNSQNPGPGSYEPILMNKPPVFTMGTKRHNMQNLNTPGPGAYDQTNSLNNTLTKSQRQATSPFGSKSKRDTSGLHYSSKSEIMLKPGPGQYSPKHDVVKYKNPSAKINKGMKGITSKDLSPGPGAYEALSKEMGKGTNKFVMGGRPSTAKVNNTPGPGAYAYQQKTITSDISRSQRGVSSMQNKSQRLTSPNRDVISSPGPGAYDANVNAIKDKVKNSGFSKTERSGFISKEEKAKPGPGNYNIPDTRSSQAFKMGQRMAQAIKNNNPGPGMYDPNPNVIKDSTRTVKISQNQQNQMSHSKSTNQIPGPGSYYNGNDFGKNAQTVSIRGKPNDNQRNDSPGPGQYEPRDVLSKDRITSANIMSGSKRQNKELNKTDYNPGPGAYRDASQDFGKDAKSFTIKQRPQDKNNNLSPGPGTYESSLNQVKDTIKSYKMGSSQRADIAPKTAREMPGPGLYESSKKFGANAVTYSIKGKPQEAKRDAIPGPGSYEAANTVVRDKSPSYRMGTSQRVQVVNKSASQMPGPGMYDAKSGVGRHGPQFTFSGKIQPKVKDFNPGPGNYEPNKDYTKDKVVSYQMGQSQRQKMVSKEASDLPGPGMYGSPRKMGHDAPQYTMGKRSKSRQELSPGPGQYDPKDYLTKDQTAKNTVSVNKSQRADIVSKQAREQPGPGQYSKVDEFGKDTKSFTIRGKPEDIRKDEVPGPGNYEGNAHIVKDRVISHKISQSQRMQIVTKEMLYVPGPGEYDSPKKFGEDAQSILIRGRPRDNSRNESPGPGMYEPNVNNVRDKVVSYKMGSTQRQEIVSKQQLQLPGPGIYEQHSSIGKTTSFTIGGKGREASDKQVPGPGQYDPKDYLTKDQTSTAYKMSSSVRQDIVSKEDLSKPGPGNYSNADQFGKDAKSFQIRGRPQDKLGNEIPGPGNYEGDANIVKDRVVAYKMGTTQRQNFVGKEQSMSPGPGQYSSPTRNSGPNYTIGGRNESPQRNDIPGPGQYEPNESAVKHKNPSINMNDGSKRTQIVSKEQMSQPGPGNYANTKNFGEDAKSFSIRGKPQDKAGDYIPGPGNYEGDANIVKDRVVSYKMSSSQRQDIVSKESNRQPGPGQYDSPQRTQGPNYTIGARVDSPQRHNIPGPGQYDPNESAVKHKNPAFNMNDGSLRTQLVSKEQMSQPGPGNYANTKNFGEDAKSFSIRGKPQDKQANDGPGPGNYEGDANIVKDRVVSFKMGSTQRQDIVSKEATRLPGPGQYDSPQKSQGPNFTIGGRVESPNRSNSPGPGHYQPNESAVKHKNPSFNMNDGSSRTQLVSKEQMSLPGPGNYADAKNFGQDAKSFTIKGKPQDKVGNDVPGPGNYEGDANIVKDRVVSYKMSSSQRQDIVSRESNMSPGPGQYESPQRNQGPNFTIGGRVDSPQRNNAPGPGQYDPNESAVKHKNPAFNMNDGSLRTQLVSKEQMSLPGPGNYADSKNFGQDAKSFSIRGKPQDKQGNEIPGPGNYDPNDSVGKYQSPSFKIDGGTQRSNLVSGEQINLPGPGVYDNPSSFGQGPSVSIRGRPTSDKPNGLPGPGQYDANVDAIKDKTSNSFRIGNHKRDFLSLSNADQNNLGPGSYDIKSGPSGPSVTIRGRDSGLPQDNIPGPGSYQPNLDATRHNNPNIDFGRSPDRSRSGSPHKDTQPGPGQYDDRDYNLGGHSVISYTIPKGEPRDPNENTPGPGHYKIPVKFADVPGYSHTAQNQEFRWV